MGVKKCFTRIKSALVRVMKHKSVIPAGKKNRWTSETGKGLSFSEPGSVWMTVSPLGNPFHNIQRERKKEMK